MTERKIIPSEAIIALMTRALNSPNGIKIECESSGQAVHIHQRYNTVRAAMTKQDPNHEWRTMQMRRDGATLLIEPTDAHLLRLKITEIEDNG